MSTDDLLSWIPELFALYTVPVILSYFYACVAIGVRRTYGNSALVGFTILSIVVISMIAPLLSPESTYLGRIPGVRTTIIAVGLTAAAVVLVVRAAKVSGVSVSATTLLKEAVWASVAFVVVALVPVFLLLVLAGMNPD